ncbi:hypothetical protein Ancab_031677 [Ancistrocladus abbreviatus]
MSSLTLDVGRRENVNGRDMQTGEVDQLPNSTSQADQDGHQTTSLDPPPSLRLVPSKKQLLIFLGILLGFLQVRNDICGAKDVKYAWFFLGCICILFWMACFKSSIQRDFPHVSPIMNHLEEIFGFVSFSLLVCLLLSLDVRLAFLIIILIILLIPSNLDLLIKFDRYSQDVCTKIIKSKAHM